MACVTSEDAPEPLWVPVRPDSRPGDVSCCLTPVPPWRCSSRGHRIAPQDSVRIPQSSQEPAGPAPRAQAEAAGGVCMLNGQRTNDLGGWSS